MGEQEGQKNDHKFIYQIVANYTNSIDVDKLDYINRDCYHLGLKDMNFENSYLIKNAKVIDDDICYPDKYAGKIYDLFN